MASERTVEQMLEHARAAAGQAAAATRGPWVAGVGAWHRGCNGLGKGPISAGARGVIANVLAVPLDRPSANSAFIAAARTDVPQLAADVEHLAGQLADMTQERDEALERVAELERERDESADLVEAAHWVDREHKSHCGRQAGGPCDMDCSEDEDDDGDFERDFEPCIEDHCEYCGEFESECVCDEDEDAESEVRADVE